MIIEAAMIAVMKILKPDATTHTILTKTESEIDEDGSYYVLHEDERIMRIKTLSPSKIEIEFNF